VLNGLKHSTVGNLGS